MAQGNQKMENRYNILVDFNTTLIKNSVIREQELSVRQVDKLLF
jgi:hypothetical protein